MDENDLLKQMGNMGNVILKEDGEDLLIYHSFWSQEEYIIKMKDYKIFPKKKLKSFISDWVSLFWEDMRPIELDMKVLYRDMKRDGMLY